MLGKEFNHGHSFSHIFLMVIACNIFFFVLVVRVTLSLSLPEKRTKKIENCEKGSSKSFQKFKSGVSLI